MKLKRKLGILFVLIALLPYVLGMVIITLASNKTIKATADGYFFEYTQNIANNVSNFFATERGFLEAFSQAPEIKSLNWFEFLPALQEIQTKSDKVGSFLLVRGDGTYYRSDNPGNPAFGGLVTPDNEDPQSQPIDLTSRDYFQRLIVNNPQSLKQIVFSNPNISKSTGKKQVVLATNILDTTGHTSGLFAVTIDGSVLDEALNVAAGDIETQFGQKGELFLISDDGALVAHRKYDKEKQAYQEMILTSEKASSIYNLEENLSNAIQTLVSENRTMLTYKNETRGTWHITGQPIHGTNYYAVFTLPEDDLYSAIRNIWKSFFAITAFTFVVVLVIALLLGRRLTTPLIETAKTLKNISKGSGDLTYRIAVNGNDEITDVGRYFNSFMETLHGMITEVKDDAATMSRLSDELSTRATSINNDIGIISSNVSDLNFQTEEQSASVTETSSTIHQIAKNIESLTQQIEGQSAGVNESSAAIQQMVSNINSITNNLERAGSGFEELLTASRTGRDSMQNVRELIKDVSNQSQHLLETNEIVDSIASQTNLLAMNAAIEAAHAGEAGKGFSVVSDEIRKLAESSSEQSRVIETALKKVVTTIDEIVDASALADEAFDSVATQINEANGLIQEIRMSMKEQNEGSRQVLEALDEIQNITVQIRDGSLEMNQGTDMILKEMTRLEDNSLKIQKNTQDIARSSDAITTAIGEIASVTERNSGAVVSLTKLADRFKT